MDIVLCRKSAGHDHLPWQIRVQQTYRQTVIRRAKSTSHMSNDQQRDKRHKIQQPVEAVDPGREEVQI